ncbi:MAG TPA: hypothetical protein VHG51_15470, partial [Longimicrobiaceae bacterium]|nr:hypothetical protein [Longimicrobiaceae bacterium]
RGRVSGDAAGSGVGGAAGRLAGEVERALAETAALDRIPGRSVSLVGLGALAAAIALSLLPQLSGVGPAWSAVMLAGGAAVAVDELRAAGRPLAAVRLPRLLAHPLFPPAFAALVGVHAFHLLRVEAVPLLWLCAAVLLGWDQARKTVLSPGGFGRYLDFGRARRGYRANVLLGAGLCLASLFLVWGETAGWLGGGYDYNYRYQGGGEYGYQYDYNPAKYYYPGFELSGRNQPLALLAEAALFALLAWAAYRGAGDAGRRADHLALGTAGFLTLWGLANLEARPGVLLFALGMAAVWSGLWRAARGVEEGPHDAAHLWARIRPRSRRG